VSRVSIVSSAETDQTRDLTIHNADNMPTSDQGRLLKLLDSIAARILSVPLLGLAVPALGLPKELMDSDFCLACKCSHLAVELRMRNIDSQFAPGWYAVLGELISIPTDTLIDMLFVIVNGEVALTAKDVAESEQIQRELQSRGEKQYWSLRAFD